MSATVTDICRRAREASLVVRELTTEVKDRVLAEMADAIDAEKERLKEANALDVEAAREAGTSTTLIDRLTLTDKRVTGMTNAIRTIIDLPDPVGRTVRGQTRPNGIQIDEVREPLGVVAVIYEARPNVTADVAALCLKSGNAAVLRGSSIAQHTNAAIADVLAEVLRRQADVPDDAVQLIRDTSREAALELLRADEYVDLLVPRGGPSLIKNVRDNATVPTVIDGDGNCHVYVDATADHAMATDIVVNGKTSRPSVCNAVETLVVHEDLAADWLPKALDTLRELGVEIRGDERTREVWPDATVVTDGDWETEYLDLILAVKVVPDMDAALAHIHRYGTHNAEAIVAQDITVARRFARAVDSGSVFVNASPRFSDGGEFGYGVEIGVSTQKLHARGPMGLESLTCVKNVVWGSGQVRVI
ncbi:glutamate-5-semialdehyde dehydrogenase [Streptomyces prunicolor]|uniref:Gamma-glutamyl phosphate reductase n=1 Tax=Streptomyces prunicolor TaxID=67348 RepID=A0ABU4FFK9_9ACTN|nr:glutamate-5-semialdehyde dehydrogenase [Streptomyces prunicolor]MCX5243616.1 glutamate-5-semialdehyde dehydrogenase [Streptomyces prunicolor]MDV7219371.1 glutamate-5-semialdehyde dehydrogenase [Streptomyces prunicolor]